MKNRVTVTIAGQEYTLVGTEEASYTEKVAAHVDAKVEEVLSGAHVSLVDGAILAAATDWQVLKNFCLCAGIPFAMVALLMPVDGFSQVPLFSVNAIGFYGFHGMVLALSVSFATLGVCRSRLRDIPGTAALLVGLGTAVHGVNVLLRATVFGGANYFYTFGLEGNVVLEGLWALLPMPLVYELPLLLVLIAVCLATTLLARLAEGRRRQNC